MWILKLSFYHSQFFHSKFGKKIFKLKLHRFNTNVHIQQYPERCCESKVLLFFNFYSMVPFFFCNIYFLFHCNFFFKQSIRNVTMWYHTTVNIWTVHLFCYLDIVAIKQNLFVKIGFHYMFSFHSTGGWNGGGGGGKFGSKTKSMSSNTKYQITNVQCFNGKS